MRQSLLLASGIAFLGCMTASGDARAELHLAFGTRWQPLRYTTTAFQSATAKAASPGSLSGFQSTSLDPYFALFFAQKYGAVLSLDIGYGKYTTERTAAMTVTPTNDSYFQFGFSLGFKWYITQPTRSKISPYLYADFFKYFASVSTDQMVTGDAAAYTASLFSPVGGSFAFGAEYFVTPSFSLGSEVLGLRVASASGELNENMAKQTKNYTYFTFYTGISLNYRFQVSAKVSATEDDAASEEPEQKPKKRKKVTEDGEQAPPPPPPPAPAAPESVD